jgi:N utilization substance protein B
MATRRDAREWSVQILFGLDLNPRDDLAKVFDGFWAEKEADTKARRFTEGLVRGVVQNMDAIDTALRKYADNWDIERMGVLDRNVMRMGLYELLFRDDIPPVVSINEAVDIAKFFSSSESGRFVNGILDRARKDLNRPARTSSSAGSGTAKPKRGQSKR